MLFDVGDFVAIDPVPPANEMRKGICRFIGETAFAEGPWVGVELVGTVGKNSGVVLDKEYFKCLPQQGVFVRPELVRPYATLPLAAAPTAVPVASCAETSTELNLRIQLEEAKETIVTLTEKLATETSRGESLELDLEIAREQLLIVETELEEVKASGPGEVRSDAAEALVAVRRKHTELEKEIASLREVNAELKDRLNAADTSDAMIESLSERKLELEEELRQTKAVLASIVVERDELREVVALQDEELRLQRDQSAEMSSALDMFHQNAASERHAATDESRKLQQRIDALERKLHEAVESQSPTDNEDPFELAERKNQEYASRIPVAVLQVLRDIKQASDENVERILARPSSVATRLTPIVESLPNAADGKAEFWQHPAGVVWQRIAVTSIRETLSWLLASSTDLRDTLCQSSEVLLLQAARQTQSNSTSSLSGDPPRSLLPVDVATSLLFLDVAASMDTLSSDIDHCLRRTLAPKRMTVPSSLDPAFWINALRAISDSAVAFHRVLRDVHKCVLLSSSSRHHSAILAHLQSLKKALIVVSGSCTSLLPSDAAPVERILEWNTPIKKLFSTVCSVLRLHSQVSVGEGQPSNLELCEKIQQGLSARVRPQTTDDAVSFAVSALHWLSRVIAPIFYDGGENAFGQQVYASFLRQPDSPALFVMELFATDSLRELCTSWKWNPEICVEIAANQLLPHFSMTKSVAANSTAVVGAEPLADVNEDRDTSACLLNVMSMVAPSALEPQQGGGSEPHANSEFIMKLENEVCDTKNALRTVEAVRDALQSELEGCRWNLWQSRSENEALSMVKADLIKMQERLQSQEVKHKERIHTVTNDYEEAIQAFRNTIQKQAAELNVLKREGLQRELSPMSLRERRELEDTIQRLRLQVVSAAGLAIGPTFKRIGATWATRSTHKKDTSERFPFDLDLPLIVDVSNKAASIKAREEVFFPKPSK